MSAGMYLKVKGNVATPNHSEYAIDSRCEEIIVAVHNARIVPGFLIVEDEDMPVYFIGGIGTNDYCIWKLESHIGGHSGKISARYLMSGDFNVQVMQRVNTNVNNPRPLVILRKDDCSYYAGNISEMTGEIQEITFKDVLAFVAGDIDWEDLQKCCTILSWNKEAELLQEARINNFIRELKSMTADRDRLVTACVESEKLYQNTKIDLNSTYKDRNEYCAKFNKCREELNGIPDWVRNFFKWWRKQWFIRS